MENSGGAERQGGIFAAELLCRLISAARKAGVILDVCPLPYACIPGGAGFSTTSLFFEGWKSPECMLTGTKGDGFNIGSVVACKAGGNVVAKLLLDAGFGMLAGATTLEELAIRMDLAGI